MRKLIAAVFVVLGFAAQPLIAQDTTAFPFAAFTDSGELIIFDDDSTELYVGVMNANASYNALMYDEISGNLYCLHDTMQGNGDREIFKFDPFTETVTLAYNVPANFLAAACMGPNGLIYAVTGNGQTPGTIYEIDVANQATTQLTSTDFTFGGTAQTGLNITYYPTTNELWLFGGQVDSLIKIDLASLTEQRVACSLASDGTIKATYLENDKFWLMSDQSYTLDINAGLFVSPSTFTPFGYITDVERLDLIEGPDTLYICGGDSVTISSRFAPDDYHWYLGGTLLGVNTPSIQVGTPGTYRLLAQSDNGGGYYVWSEEVVVLTSPSPTAGFSQSADTVYVGTAVNFTDNSTGATVYHWDFGDGNYSTSASPSHAWTTAGTYSVMQLVGNGTCRDSIFSEVVVLPLVGIADGFGNGGLGMSCYPNPVLDNAVVAIHTTEAMQASIELLDLSGRSIRVIFDGEINGEAKFSLQPNQQGAPLPAGTYMLRLSTEKGSIVRRVAVIR
ncbi:MAG: PKD domain-containing protein [Bacteroidia bacterium]